MERIQENQSKLLKAIDIAFVPTSLLRLWDNQYKKDDKDFKDRDYVSIGEMIYSAEKIVSFVGAAVLELGRAAAYCELVYLLLNNT
ncbi:MAG TPA: hypothetical protein VJ438_00535 [Candidatus Nanoarchaeia archaeon]|nr:hypothetical protein [Candidatus Nanoarchaeia archaeon]